MSHVATPERHCGLTVTAIRHQSCHRAFPNGIWYGMVEGRDCTAPVWDAETAIAHAKGQIDNGGLVCALLTSIKCMEGWIASGDEKPSTREEIMRERSLLKKVLPAVKDLEDQFFAADAKAQAALAP